MSSQEENPLERGLKPGPKESSSACGHIIRVCRAHRGWTTLGALVLCLALALSGADALLARPMRNWAERVMNSELNGYKVHIAKVRPHLWRLALDLEGLVLVQNMHPDPPGAEFGALKFSLVVRELLHLKVAGDLTLERPALHINRIQIEEEARTYVSLKARGWQRAVESIYPFKLDRVRVEDGSLLYLSSRTASKPLRLTRIVMAVSNVRNKASVKGTYPSPVTLEGVLFDTGTVAFKGAADFLREPYPAARGEIKLTHVPLDRLDPLTKDFQLETTGGLLSLSGVVESTPEVRTAHLAEVLLEELRVDYLTSRATKVLEMEHARAAIKLAKRLRNAPELLLRVDTLKLVNSQFGFVNHAANPTYRLFMSGMNLELRNLSNHADLGRSEFDGKGTFMGSGTTHVSGSATVMANPADFAVHLQMDQARLTDLNGLLMAHAGVDVAEGSFSIYAEITVRRGRVEGYLKPLFRNVKVSDKEKDRNKTFAKRMEMRLLQFLINVSKKRSTQEVATVVRISGTTSDPKLSGWSAILRLFGNGFAQGIHTGFMDGSEALAPTTPSSHVRAMRRSRGAGTR